MNNIQLNINVTFAQLLEAVKQLSPKEKLILNDAIWNEKMDIPLEQQLLVSERKQKSQKDPELMLDWNDATASLSHK